MRTALLCSSPKIGTFGAQNRSGQRYSVAALGNSVLVQEKPAVKEKPGNGMELNAKFREWSRGIAESEQTFLGKAEACVGVVVKEDSP